MIKFINKAPIFLIICLFFSTSVIPVFASTSANLEHEKILQIALPDTNGNLRFYSGTQAQQVYQMLKADANKILPETSNIFMQGNETLRPTINPTPKGMFTYKYRFIKQSEGFTWGTTKRISTYAVNCTNTTQSVSVNAHTSVSWSIDATLSNEFKNAFSSSVGIGWQHTSAFSETLTRKVQPKKRVWIEFQPRLKYVKGEVQKYYIPRGPVNKIPIVVSRKSVYSTSPTTIRVSFGGKNISCPDGVYIWKEDSNYNCR